MHMERSKTHTSTRLAWTGIILRSLGFALLGTFALKLARYWSELVRQPPLIAATLHPELDSGATLLDRAASIAMANLEDGIELRQLSNGDQKLILRAGWRNFREPWARDLSFAIFGLLEIGAVQAARESLETFLVYQRPNGQFPIKLHSTNLLDRFMHSVFRREQPIRAPLQPKYKSGHNTVSLDGNALLIIAAAYFVNKTNDLKFAAAHLDALEKGFHWLEDFVSTDDGLLCQSAFSDWADSIARTGRVLYTNVVYWKAARSLADVAGALGMADKARFYYHKAEMLCRAINDHFWREDLGYFVTSEQFDNLSSSGNLLAIAWKLASEDQAQHILDRMDEWNMAVPVPTRVVHMPYRSRYVALENRLIGLGHYHTQAAWLWLGAWHVIALLKTDRISEAETLLARIAEVVVRDGVVHEVYGPDGRFVARAWYISEAPLSWSAGMVVYAYAMYLRALGRQGLT